MAETTSKSSCLPLFFAALIVGSSPGGKRTFFAVRTRLAISMASSSCVVPWSVLPRVLSFFCTRMIASSIVSLIFTNFSCSAVNWPPPPRFRSKPMLDADCAARCSAFCFGKMRSNFSMTNFMMPVIFEAFIMLSIVSTSGRSRIWPNTIARLAGDILLLPECSPTQFRNSRRISARALLAAGRSSTSLERDSMYFCVCALSWSDCPTIPAFVLCRLQAFSYSVAASINFG
mmetsp:Transcript_15919/g.62204  ORF Transcript_15919/g.62204 Transcript_15919/m.62204 type:complete len:231 (+) Transcript_15919:893-1585(+)